MFTRRYYVYATISVPARLLIAANNPEEARKRAEEGAWQAVAPNYDQGKTTAIHEVQEQD